MEEPVLGDLLRKGEWLLKDLGPVLNSCDIISQILTLAVVKGIWQVVDDFTDVLDPVDEISSFDIGKGCLSIGDNDFTSLEALLDLCHVIVTSKSEDKSSDPVWDCLYVKCRSSGNDCCCSECGSHSVCLINN